MEEEELKALDSKNFLTRSYNKCLEKLLKNKLNLTAYIQDESRVETEYSYQYQIPLDNQFIMNVAPPKEMMPPRKVVDLWIYYPESGFTNREQAYYDFTVKLKVPLEVLTGNDMDVEPEMCAAGSCSEDNKLALRVALIMFRVAKEMITGQLTFSLNKYGIMMREIKSVPHRKLPF